MEQRFDFFSDHELVCHCGCKRGEDYMNAEFMNKIVSVRRMLNRPMIVSSGYRCSGYNLIVSETGRDGPHTTGHAIDIRIYGYWAKALVNLACLVGIPRIGLSQAGPMNARFVHLDDLKEIEDRPSPWIWTY